VLVGAHAQDVAVKDTGALGILSRDPEEVETLDDSHTREHPTDRGGRQEIRYPSVRVLVAARPETTGGFGRGWALITGGAVGVATTVWTACRVTVTLIVAVTVLASSRTV
jgi:hypothetical protein